MKTVQTSFENLKGQTGGISEALETSVKQIVTETEKAAADVKNAIEKKSTV